MNKKDKFRVVIAGGGTAGWITAAALAKAVNRAVEIILVESDDIPTVGVGEATIPPLHLLHKILGVDEREFLARTNGTFKLGIQFENWKQPGHSYIHSFGQAGKDNWACGFQHFWVAGQAKGFAKPYGDYCLEHLAARNKRFAVLPKNGINYAYHLDAGLYAKFLREISENNGVVRQEGKIQQVHLHHHNGYIASLELASGQRIEGDLFVDCTGFRGLLIEQTLHAGYDDYSHWLPCNSAVAMQTEKTEAPIPYTRSIARDCGWQWRIPLQNRVGNGLVFCNKYISDDEAVQTLKANVTGKPLNEPRVIRFQTGMRRRHWVKNCVAIGLSSGFLEPLESTSIHLIQKSAIRLAQLLPADGHSTADIDEFNEQAETDFNFIRDFIILHYKVTERRDTDFWRYCAGMSVPASLERKIKLFVETGKIYQHPSELFAEESWMQVMYGQGLMPKTYHPLVSSMTDEALNKYLDDIWQSTHKRMSQLPLHHEFIDYYCKAAMAQ